MKEIKTLGKLEDEIKSLLNALAFSPNITACDHLCYIAKNDDSYKNWLKRSQKLGSIIREFNGAGMNLAGKNFLIIRLSTPITFLNQSVEILEIKQSDNPDFIEDWQHAEFIPNCSLAEILEKNCKVSFESSRINDSQNPEIGIRFSKQYSLKFRSRSIAEQ